MTFKVKQQVSNYKSLQTITNNYKFIRMTTAEITGFIGTFFLIVRLFPLIYEQIRTPYKINMSFLLIEVFACLFLGVSAVLYNALPFVIANILSFINLMIILSIQFRLRMCVDVDKDDSIV
jgi:uncharacterized protein with PQ loop repeat